MPTTRKIPARIEKICEPCEYHKRINAFYGKDYSWAEYSCMHPNAFEPVEGKFREQFKEYAVTSGRFIGRTELQPAFCPLNKIKK